MKDFSYITNSSPAFIESLYQEFLKNPANVDPGLKKFFEGFDFALTTLKPAGSNGMVVNETPVSAITDIDWKKELSVYRMILGYRNKGHLIAKTNPIRERKDRDANLNLNFFGLEENLKCEAD